MSPKDSNVSLLIDKPVCSLCRVDVMVYGGNSLVVIWCGIKHQIDTLLVLSSQVPQLLHHCTLKRVLKTVWMIHAASDLKPTAVFLSAANCQQQLRQQHNWQQLQLIVP